MRWFEPQRFFAIAALLFGTALAFVTPPFQSPDEPTHFFRSYQISEGVFVSDWQENTGIGMLPASLAAVCRPFANVRFNRVTTSWRAIQSVMDIPLRPKERTEFVIGNSSSYPPIVFAPQAIAIALGRFFGCPPLALMYLARVANLWTWIGIGYCALVIAPAFAQVLLMLMLMPMSICQAASISPDAITNGLAFVVTALIFRAVFGAHSKLESRIGGQWLTAFVLCSAVFSLTKAAYLPLTGMVLLIPPRRFGGRRRFAIVLLLIASACIIPLLLWASLTPGLDMVIYPSASYVNAHRQFEFLKAHPAAFVQIPLLSAQRDGILVILSFIGRLGWLNIRLSPVFIAGYYIALILSCRPDADEPRLANPWKFAAIILAAVIASTEAVLLLNYLFWTSVGAPRVDGLQGRYFIPIAPAMLLLVYSVWRCAPTGFRSHQTTVRRNAAVALITFASCAYVVILLYFHYFVSVGVGGA